MLLLQLNKFTLQQRLEMFESLYQRFVHLSYAKAAVVELVVKLNGLLLFWLHTTRKSALQMKVKITIFLLH